MVVGPDVVVVVRECRDDVLVQTNYVITNNGITLAWSGKAEENSKKDMW